VKPKSQKARRLGPGGGERGAILVTEGTISREQLNAAIVAEDLLQELSEPLEPYGHATTVSASLGIAVLHPCAGTRLLMEADAAMYHVKRNGGNDYQFYTEETTL
jgi:diguanylate cyclase